MKGLKMTICGVLAWVMAAVSVGTVPAADDNTGNTAETGSIAYHGGMAQDYNQDTDITENLVYEGKESFYEKGTFTILANSEKDVTIRNDGSIRLNGAGSKTGNGGILRAIKVEIPEDAVNVKFRASIKSQKSSDPDPTNRYLAIADSELNIINAIGETAEGSQSGQKTDMPAPPYGFDYNDVESKNIYGNGTYYIYSTYSGIEIAHIEITWEIDSGEENITGMKQLIFSKSQLAGGESDYILDKNLENLGTDGAFSILANSDYPVTIRPDGQIRTGYTGKTDRNCIRVVIPEDAKDARLVVRGSSGGDTVKYLFISDGENEINADPLDEFVSDIPLPVKSVGTKAITSATYLQPGTYYLYSKMGGCWIENIVISWASDQTETKISGDIDGDGFVTSNDAAIVSLIVSGSHSVSWEEDMADVNADGKVSFEDGAEIMKKVLRSSYTFKSETT